MSVTAFNRRRREIARRQAEQDAKAKATPPNPEPAPQATTQSPKRRKAKPQE